MILVFIALILALTGFFLLLVMESRKEIPPATALVYNNIWTGHTQAHLPGTEFIIPGIHRVLKGEVSLRNEAENPSNIKLFTADGVELEVDYIIRRLQVGYPEMPAQWGNVDKNRLRDCAIQAVTAIEYGKRRDKILTRVVACLQATFEKRTLNELFSGADPETGAAGRVNPEEKGQLEDEVNNAILEDIATVGWGFWIEMDLEDYDLPAVIRTAREKKSSAKIAGEALRDRLTAAGVDNVGEWAGRITIAETIADALRNITNKEK